MIHVCTSFNPHQYEVYGKRFVESYKRFVDKPLHVFHEGGFSAPGVECHDLREDADLQAFLKEWGPKPYANGLIKGSINYRYQAVKFAKKVFAYTKHPKLTADDWWVWIDADVEFHAPVTDQWWARACPGGFLGSYIGRRKWSHPECGFMGFSMRYHGAEVLKQIRDIYTSGLLFGLPEWHDSYVFGVVQRSWDLKGRSQFFDLARDVEEKGDVPHPWPDTVLGEVCQHNKGPVAKREMYGEVA